LTRADLADQASDRPRTLGRAGAEPSDCAPMGARPLLFVDVDGVISLWGFALDRVPPGRWALVEGVPHFLSVRAAEHLLTLSAHFDLVWCTGWEEKADEHLPHLLRLPVGLPHLSFDRTRDEVSRHGHWKLAAIEQHAGDRPLAWIDDALDDACRAWAQARPAPTLLVQTDPAVGLADEHAETLRSFALGMQAGR